MCQGLPACAHLIPAVVAAPSPRSPSWVMVAAMEDAVVLQDEAPRSVSYRHELDGGWPPHSPCGNGRCHGRLGQSPCCLETSLFGWDLAATSSMAATRSPVDGTLYPVPRRIHGFVSPSHGLAGGRLGRHDVGDSTDELGELILCLKKLCCERCCHLLQVRLLCCGSKRKMLQCYSGCMLQRASPMLQTCFDNAEFVGHIYWMS
jgi:hypothetical protein